MFFAKPCYSFGYIWLINEIWFTISVTWAIYKFGINLAWTTFQNKSKLNKIPWFGSGLVFDFLIKKKVHYSINNSNIKFYIFLISGDIYTVMLHYLRLFIMIRNHWVKSVCFRSYSAPYFPKFGLNTESLLRITPYSVRMRENAGQNNSEYRHLLRSEYERCMDEDLQVSTVLWLLLLCWYLI